ncbi:MAG: hypothetical protein Q8J97_04980, partial [Flavobacteriaceae bacterium]|nr:hypothetical protein [Flavobacteriaceae bacterium]
MTAAIQWNKALGSTLLEHCTITIEDSLLQSGSFPIRLYGNPVSTTLRIHNSELFATGNVGTSCTAAILLNANPANFNVFISKSLLRVRQVDTCASVSTFFLDDNTGSTSNMQVSVIDTRFDIVSTTPTTVASLSFMQLATSGSITNFNFTCLRCNMTLVDRNIQTVTGISVLAAISTVSNFLIHCLECSIGMIARGAANTFGVSIDQVESASDLRILMPGVRFFTSGSSNTAFIAISEATTRKPYPRLKIDASGGIFRINTLVTGRVHFMSQVEMSDASINYDNSIMQITGGSGGAAVPFQIAESALTNSVISLRGVTATVTLTTGDIYGLLLVNTIVSSTRILARRSSF